MYDFCINGGGMVGASLALGLVQQGYRIAIIESVLPSPFSPEQPPDLRVSAISVTSVQLLKRLGAWPYIENSRLREYSELAVWESPSMATEFVADEIGEPLLGYFVENRLLQLGCHEALAGTDVHWITDATLSAYQLEESGVSVSLSNGDTLVCRYLIGADGAKSQVRTLADIGASGWQYAQQALGITVALTAPCAARTWQQFFPTGPRALLPMYENYASLIWYDKADRIKALKQLKPASLKQAILNDFPPLPSDFNVIDKAAFVLTRSHASQYVQPGIILIGDAAHTINPLAGQGVNLGFKDVSALLTITELLGPDKDDFYLRLQQAYEGPRKRDNGLMMSAMDGFYLLFSNQIAPLKWMRNAMLKGADVAGPVKHQVLRYAMGMSEWKF